LKLEEGEDAGADEEGGDVDSNDGSDGEDVSEALDVEGGEDDDDGEEENAPVELEELDQEVRSHCQNVHVILHS
jgi:hypothetical protein